MKALYFFVIIICVTLFGCKKKTGHPPGYIENYLSQEVMDFFVDYKVGTKWVYKDTTGYMPNDTIELISKSSRDIDYQQGFELYFQPKITRHFKFWITTEDANRYKLRMYPMEDAVGMVTADYQNGKWDYEDALQDSLELLGKTYYEIFNFHPHATNTYIAMVKYAKKVGMINFYNNRNSGYYQLIKVIEP